MSPSAFPGARCRRPAMVNDTGANRGRIGVFPPQAGNRTLEAAERVCASAGGCFWRANQGRSRWAGCRESIRAGGFYDLPFKETVLLEPVR